MNLPLHSPSDVIDVTSDAPSQGFTLARSDLSSRLECLSIEAAVIEEFLQSTAALPVQALEYKSFLRFKVAAMLDELCAGTLRPVLLEAILDRSRGALLVDPQGLDQVADADGMVKFSTAISHLIGRANFDAMSGQYYARFTVVNSDDSDSFLRQPHRVMELHNDGTYVDEITDFVLMMKIDERNMSGGNSLLLHLDDWPELEAFFAHPLARREMRWSAPPSKNTHRDVFHPVFGVDAGGRPTMRYIDQFVQPKDFEEGLWLDALSESLESCKAKLSVPVPVGNLLLINNLFWLHGRDRFEPHPELRRELLRQRGYLSFPAQRYRYGQ